MKNEIRKIIILLIILIIFLLSLESCISKTEYSSVQYEILVTNTFGEKDTIKFVANIPTESIEKTQFYMDNYQFVNCLKFKYKRNFEEFNVTVALNVDNFSLLNTKKL